MIIIINGPCGIGKSTTAEHVTWKFDRAVFLDGDYIGSVHPFEIYDDVRIEHLYQTLRLLIAFHIEHGDYHNFVIPYVFESPESLARLPGAWDRGSNGRVSWSRSVWVRHREKHPPAATQLEPAGDNRGRDALLFFARSHKPAGLQT